MLWPERVTTGEVRAVGHVALARGKSDVIRGPERVVGSEEVDRTARYLSDCPRGRSAVIRGLKRVVGSGEGQAVGRGSGGLSMRQVSYGKVAQDD